MCVDVLCVDCDFACCLILVFLLGCLFCLFRFVCFVCLLFGLSLFVVLCVCSMLVVVMLAMWW